MKLADRIELAANGEEIECACVGNPGTWCNPAETPPSVPDELVGKRLPWNEARKWLDYEHSDDLADDESHNVIAWTRSRIVFISEYDGSTSVCWLPRNPIDELPEYGGNRTLEA